MPVAPPRVVIAILPPVASVGDPDVLAQHDPQSLLARRGVVELAELREYAQRNP